MPERTRQQCLAIETKGVPVVLSAGAGCGKTFVLVERYLAALEQSQGDVSKIVAFTFTDRAAREMRDRVREACRARLKTCRPGETDHWEQAFSNLSDARISTIHSFCTEVLQRFYEEAGLREDCEVLAGPTARSAQRKVVADELNRLLGNEDEHAMRIVLRFGVERTIAMLMALLPGPMLADSLVNLSPQRLVERWQSTWDREALPALIDEFLDSHAVRAALEAIEHGEFTGPTMTQRRAEMIEEFTLLEGKMIEPFAALERLHKAARVHGATTEISRQSYDTIKRCLEKLREAISEVIAQRPEEDASQLFQTAEVCVSAARVTDHMRHAYRRYKNESGLLDYDDQIFETVRLLERSVFVRERLTSEIDHLLVDEFQDTDPDQDRIVRLLTESGETNRFLVGDSRQSIYRFRGADPALFDRHQEDCPEDGRLSLSRNFRSRPEIVDFVNSVFKSRPGFHNDPLVAQRDSGGQCVEFLFADESTRETTRGRWLREEQQEIEAKWIAARIRRLIDAGIAPGEIAVLFRSIRSVGIYEEHLRRLGIDYYLVGSRAFFAQQEVFDVANLLRAIDDPDDEVALLGVLRSPFFSWSDDTILLMAQNEGSFASAVLSNIPSNLEEDQQIQVRFAQRTLQFLRANKDRFRLSELLETALEKTAFDASIAIEFLGERKYGNLLKIVAMAKEMESSTRVDVGLSEFVDWLDDSIRDVSDEALAATESEAGDVVRLMTVHQAKGLEFPVVVVADCGAPSQTDRQLKPHIDHYLSAILSIPTTYLVKYRHPGIGIAKIRNRAGEMAESDRLLYVALTRAEERLILSGAFDRRAAHKSQWLSTISTAYDLESGESICSGPGVIVHSDCPAGAEAEAKSATVLPYADFERALESSSTL